MTRDIGKYRACGHNWETDTEYVAFDVAVMAYSAEDAATQIGVYFRKPVLLRLMPYLSDEPSFLSLDLARGILPL